MSARKIAFVTDQQTYWRFSDEVIIPGYVAIAPEAVPGGDLPPPLSIDQINEITSED